MKKLIFLFLLFPILSSAQVYLGANGTYNFASGGRSMGEFLLMDITANQSVFDNRISENKVSFGGGIHFSPILGYRINKYLGIELQGTMFKTKEVATQVSYIEPSDDRVSIDMQGDLYSIRPSILAYIYKDKPLVYVKVGAVYTAGEFVVNVDYQKLQKQTAILINGGQSIGISFAAGVDWSLSNRLFLRMELSHINASYFPKKGTFTKFDLGGVDQLPAMSNEQKTLDFVREGVIDQTYLGATLEAGTHLSTQFPLSSYGINIGLLYKFNKLKN